MSRVRGILRSRFLATGVGGCWRSVSAIARRSAGMKVVEETPAPGISEETRAGLFGAATKLGEAVSYRSAGTVEFVFDADTGAYYFLEVNTRLQVEHGVTEEVTGVDLVEWMVRLAASETKFLDAFSGKRKGHSIRSHLRGGCEQEFPAELRRSHGGQFPPEFALRNAVEDETEVTPFYDPMLAESHCARRGPARRNFTDESGAGRDPFRRHRIESRVSAPDHGDAGFRRRKDHHEIAERVSVPAADHRRSRRGSADDRPGLPGPDRILERRRAAIGADGSAGFPLRKPTAQQSRIRSAWK